MPKLKIDGLEIEVPKGMKVIEAAARLGIIIPRFCYHAGLGSVGACRMCAVKFLEGPVKGVQMSCMVDSQDGMVVSTTDEEAVDFRRHVIEWLMMNHPHDCPVCDEGGHCLLQDMTVAGGHGVRRYLGKKRTYLDQYLGVFVQHEMNRCIHCWRCRRFYQEFAGYRDLGALQISNRTYFGRYKDGPLESPFAGNLIDLCPTGVYTDKPSRFKGRRWDYERSPSLCIHCSLGCHIITSSRYREVVRLEAHFNEAVNGYFICDRGRYGFDYTNHPARPRKPKVGGEEVSWDGAMRKAAERVSEITQKTGPASIDCVGSVRSSLETQWLLKRFCRSLGCREPVYFENPSVSRKAKDVVSGLDPSLAISMREIEKADLILVIGADPVNEAPMLALAMRQAHRNGATVAAIDPRSLFLPFEFYHLPLVPGDMELYLDCLIKETIGRPAVERLGQSALRFYDSLPALLPMEPALKEVFETVRENLLKCRRPVIVCGTDIVCETTPALAADYGRLLQAEKERVGLFYLMPGANAFGAAVLSSEGRSLSDTVYSIEKGEVKALVLVECDPLFLFPDKERLRKALHRLDLLIVMDYLPSEAVKDAGVFMPTRTLFETETAFVNQEARVQFSSPAHCGGVPIEQITGGGHPPRTFRNDIPGNEPRAAWQILADLGDLLTLPGDWKGLSREGLMSWMAREDPPFANMHKIDLSSEGARLISSQGKEESFSVNPILPAANPAAVDSLEVLFVDWTFGTEELSRYSSHIEQAEPPPCLRMHPKDAEERGLKSRDRVILHLEGGPLEIEVIVAENMAHRGDRFTQTPPA